MDSDYSRATAAASSMYVYTFLMAVFVVFFSFCKCQRISWHHPIDLSISFSFFRQHLLKGFLLHVLFGELKLWKPWAFSPLNSRWCFVCFFSLSSLFCLKGQKLKFYHDVIPNLYGFLLWNTREDIVKNVGNQTVSVLIDFHLYLKKKKNFCRYNESQW